MEENLEPLTIGGMQNNIPLSYRGPVKIEFKIDAMLVYGPAAQPLKNGFTVHYHRASHLILFLN
jgi:hypothetical protein